MVGAKPKFAATGSTVALTPGTAKSLTLTATGYPAPTMTFIGALPPGMTFVDRANGSATISGTPTTVGLYSVTVYAENALGTATYTYAFKVGTAPAFASKTVTDSFVKAKAKSFVVQASGSSPTYTETGALPPGLAFKDLGNGTASLSGTTSAVGRYQIAVTARNDLGSASETITINVTAS